MKHYVLLPVALVATSVLILYGVGRSLAGLDPARLDPLRGEEAALVSSAPQVPPPITRNYAAKVILNLEVKEHTQTLSDGVSYTYWTFGDDAPGNFIRVREGDLVETHLHNHPDNTVAHNIDFHSATGPGGGAEASFVAPGHSATFSWRAMRPGLFLYHCVAAPAGLHLSNGMYGLILVEPKGGLPKVDKEYFIVQGEFYTRGEFGESGLQQFSMEKALREEPVYVVFNGHVGALMGDKALQVKSGESVRLYLGNAGPSLISSFHIVGEIFDRVYGEGGTNVTQRNVQTTMIPAGGSAIVEFGAEVPGSYQLVDHSMFRAFNKGAMGMMQIEGPELPQIFSGRTASGVYSPGTRLQRLDAMPASAALLDHGKRVYSTTCVHCHQPDGRGLPNIFPPLAQSDFLMADKERAVKVLLQGLQGRIIVNGQTFDGVMPQQPLNDAEVASVLTYVRNNFGNTGTAVTVADVQQVRASLEVGSRR